MYVALHLTLVAHLLQPIYLGLLNTDDDESRYGQKVEGIFLDTNDCIRLNIISEQTCWRGTV